MWFGEQPPPPSSAWFGEQPPPPSSAPPGSQAAAAAPSNGWPPPTPQGPQPPNPWNAPPQPSYSNQQFAQPPPGSQAAASSPPQGNGWPQQPQQSPQWNHTQVGPPQPQPPPQWNAVPQQHQYHAPQQQNGGAWGQQPQPQPQPQAPQQAYSNQQFVQPQAPLQQHFGQWNQPNAPGAAPGFGHQHSGGYTQPQASYTNAFPPPQTPLPSPSPQVQTQQPPPPNAAAKPAPLTLWQEQVALNEWARTLQDLLDREPVVTLEQALRPLEEREGRVYAIMRHMTEAQRVARTRVARMKAEGVWQPTESVTEAMMVDGIAMIWLYTVEIVEDERSGFLPLYRLMNRAMTRHDRSPEDLKDWMPCIKLLDTALVRLPSKYHVGREANGGKVRLYRGLPWRFPTIDQPDPESHFPEGSYRWEWRFMSYCKNLGVAFSFSGDRKPGTVFDASACEGYSISEFSAVPEENEVVFRPLTLFRVVAAMEGSPLDRVRLEQIDRLAPSPNQQPSGQNPGQAHPMPVASKGYADRTTSIFPLGQSIEPRTDAQGRGIWHSTVLSIDWGRTFTQLLSQQPIVELTDAMRPLEGLVYDVQDYARRAKANAKQHVQRLMANGEWVSSSGQRGVGMMEDGIAMIELYTEEWAGVEGLSIESLYTQMNRELYRPDRSPDNIRAWLPAIKLLDSALQWLPQRYRVGGNAANGKYLRVYRGMKWRFPSPQAPDPVNFFCPGQLRMMWAFTSTTRDTSVLRSPQFCGTSGPRTIFDIEVSEGYDVSAFSAIKKENEVLVRPLSLFRLVRAINVGAVDAPDMVHMVQVGRDE